MALRSCMVLTFIISVKPRCGTSRWNRPSGVPRSPFRHLVKQYWPVLPSTRYWHLYMSSIPLLKNSSQARALLQVQPPCSSPEPQTQTFLSLPLTLSRDVPIDYLRNSNNHRLIFRICQRAENRSKPLLSILSDYRNIRGFDIGPFNQNRRALLKLASHSSTKVR